VKNGPTGNKEFKPEMVDGLCYPVGKVQQIEDYRGQVVISNSHIYIPGEIEMNVQDSIILDGAVGTIKNITSFWRAGKVDVKVVYL
jgi:hypothetical protein